MDIFKYDYENLNPEDFEHPDILQHLHYALFEVLLIKGSLICKGCGKTYPVNNGIPDLVLNDEDI